MIVLVINTGSSSIKYRLYRMPDHTPAAAGVVERIGESQSRLTHQSNGDKQQISVRAEDHDKAMELILQTLMQTGKGLIDDISEIAAVGHRVVHGAEEFTGSVVIDEKVTASLQRYADLAPLHNPPNLIGIRAARRYLPAAVQVACFDTAFHTTIPPVAYIYPLPYEIYEKYRVRRYGFHGTSHRYVARRAAQIMNKHKYALNAITCHLGNGCSITAVKQGRSVDTSMGFTPLEGLVMGTRSGDFDPAILFYLADKGHDIASLNAMCNKQSGLIGISGISNDMRNLTDLARQGDPRANLAVDIFAYRVKKYIGAYTAVLDTVDALVFTGGIGENAVDVRTRICTGLTQVGIRLDDDKNRRTVAAEGIISADSSPVKVFVIPTDEEAAIARDTYELASGRQNQ